jgi:hypothetical protein
LVDAGLKANVNVKISRRDEFEAVAEVDEVAKFDSEGFGSTVTNFSALRKVRIKDKAEQFDI